MTEKTEVVCTRADCLFHNLNPASDRTILCSHQDKRHHLHDHPCPLYRLDWAKMALQAQKITKKW